MKKIYYLLALLVLAFTACQKQPNLVPTTFVKAMNLTLATADYQLLPSTDYPYTSLSFNSLADANTYIPVILNARDPQLGNGSTANVTFSFSPIVSPADSAYSDIAYTVTSADYVALGSSYGDFSASDILNFLAYKYPNPSPNQLAVVTYVLYTGSDNTVTNSFLYLNGGWLKIYQVTPAEYTEAGEGKYDQFTKSDQPNLPADFNLFLKTDISAAGLADTVKANDIEYVSYSYYGGGNYQRILALTYNGSSWVTTGGAATRAFLKSGGVWIPDPTVYYTLSAADVKLIAASSFGTTSQRTSLGKYGDFSGWSASDLDNALILVLTTDFPNPKVKVNYNITYLNYTGGADVPTVVTFQYNGTAWAVQ
jgi:hypothetical protein